MSLFGVLMKYSDGTEEEIDEVFESEEEAEEYASYAASCYKIGGEILEMSNMGDYPFDEDDEADYEIFEIDN